MTQLLKAPRQEKAVISSSPMKRWKLVGRLGLWMIFWLTLIDIGINVLFPSSRDNNQDAGTIARYFDYGRSIEDKLDRMVGSTTENSDLIVASGWIDPESWQDLPQVAQDDDDLLLVNYGMSFSDYVSQAVATIDSRITVRSIGGPSAPPNHSFAAFKADSAGRENADVVMIGILASTVKRMSSMSGTNWTYEVPNPYMYPYYSVNQENELTVVEPAISTADDFVEAFNRRDEIWQRSRVQLAKYDKVFDPFVYQANWTDRSAIVRLIRRGWAERARSLGEQDLFDAQEGFNLEASEIITLKALLQAFSSEVRSAEQVPVILLINDQGYDAKLYEVLASHVESLDALIFSTHEVAPANDPKNFIVDGHFTDEANERIAAALQKQIRAELAASK